jgi:hypothetical protein
MGMHSVVVNVDLQGWIDRATTPRGASEKWREKVREFLAQKKNMDEKKKIGK